MSERENYLIHLDKSKFNVDFKFLEKEVYSLAYQDYGSVFKSSLHKMSKSSRWMNEVKEWQVSDIPLAQMPESKSFFDIVSSIVDTDDIKVTTCRALKLFAGTKLIMHEHTRVPGQNHLCVNYVCGGDNSPLFFKNYGDIDYKIALINSVLPHCIEPYHRDRFVVGVQLEYLNNSFQWSDVVKIFQDKGYLLKC